MICSPLQRQPVKCAVGSYSHLQHLQLADDGDPVSIPEIDILAGADFYWHIVTGNAVRVESSPVAMETKLGYVLSGPVHDDGDNAALTNLISTHLLKAEIIINVRDGVFRKELDWFWDLNSIGIWQGEDIVHEQFNDGVKFKNIMKFGCPGRNCNAFYQIITTYVSED